MGQVNHLLDLLDAGIVAARDVVCLDVDVVDGVRIVLSHVILVDVGLQVGRSWEREREEYGDIFHRICEVSSVTSLELRHGGRRSMLKSWFLQ